jgi:hypothetical protein
MKNLYLLPTDKQSRLVKIKDTFFLTSTDNIPGGTFYNIYITSDEEIGEGDCYLDTTVNVIFKNDKLFLNGTGYKKIILSTDPTLIADGVQSIDDEFLLWFVKNSSCEFVEVIRNKKLSGKNIFDAKEGDLVFNNHGFGGIIQELSNDIRVHIVSENGEGYMETAITADNGIDTLIINNYKVYEYSDYKIIIPEEEPKQEFLFFDKEIADTITSEGQKTVRELQNTIQQETLEEAAENESEYLADWEDKSMYVRGFVNGAKWQAERMYSEEDLREAFKQSRQCKIFEKDMPPVYETFEEWFEQFKKK